MGIELPLKVRHESFPIEGDVTLFSAWDERINDGMFQYHGNQCEKAIRLDSVPMLLEAIERGWLEHDTETFDQCRMVKHAKRCGSFAVAAKLVALGWEDEGWAHGITVGPKAEAAREALRHAA